MMPLTRRLMMSASVGLMLAPAGRADAQAPDTDWRNYANDLANTRYAPLDQINAGNFGKLEVAWRFKPDNLGPHPEYNWESTPLVIAGRLYVTAGGRRDAVVHVAGQLADLHQHALHRAEGVGHVLRGAQGQVVPQLLAVLARRGEQPGRVHRVPGAAPRGEPHRGEPAADPQLGLVHARASCAARIRSVSRWRASSTPGSPM